MIRQDRQDGIRSFPWLSMILIAWCVVVFLFINTHRQAVFAETMRYGLISDAMIFRGAYWGLVSMAFVHVEPMHLLFNLYWLWILGGAFERRFGPISFAGFVIGSAFVSSGVQLLSGSAGIGLSGVGYALFGFAWIARTRVPEFARIVNDRTVMVFILWGLFCVFATYTGMMQIANLAHAGGLAFGVGLAFSLSKGESRVMGIGGLAVLAAAAAMAVTWNPKSADWVGIRAERSYAAGRYTEALGWFQKYMDAGGDKSWGLAASADIYARTKDWVRYADAVRKLNEIDTAAALDLMKQYGVPEGMQPDPHGLQAPTK